MNKNNQKLIFGMKLLIQNQSSMNKEEVLEMCKNLVLEEKAYHEIKATLEKMPLDAPLIKAALEQADQWIVAYELEQQVREKYLIQIVMGVALMVLALLLNIFSTVNILILGVIMLIGAWIIYNGYTKYQIPPTLSTIVTEKRKKKFERF